MMQPREPDTIHIVCRECHSLKQGGADYRQITEIEYNVLVQGGKVSQGYCPPCLEYITETQGIENV